MEGLSSVSLIATIKVIFAKYGILHRLMSGAGSNFVSETFRSFCSSLNIEQACFHCINTKARDRSKPASNSLSTL